MKKELVYQFQPRNGFYTLRLFIKHSSGEIFPDMVITDVNKNTLILLALNRSLELGIPLGNIETLFKEIKE